MHLKKKILQFLIGNLNDYGFLELDVHWTASHFSIARGRNRKYDSNIAIPDPIGVGAKDLADCLLIQLRGMRIVMNWRIRSLKST